MTRAFRMHGGGPPAPSVLVDTGGDPYGDRVVQVELAPGVIWYFSMGRLAYEAALCALVMAWETGRPGPWQTGETAGWDPGDQALTAVLEVEGELHCKVGS